MSITMRFVSSISRDSHFKSPDARLHYAKLDNAVEMKTSGCDMTGKQQRVVLWKTNWCTSMKYIKRVFTTILL